MKTSILLVFTVASLISGVLAQDQGGTNSTEQVRHAGTAMSGKPLTVSGTVSPDARTLLTDIDSEWAINNPEMLKGREGLHVTVKCYVDSENGRIQILRVKPREGDKYASKKYADSAFRR